MALWKKFRSRPPARAALLLVGALALLAGIYREETAVVLNKAIFICLECIGIG